jgi:hypothetical protein
VHVDFTLMTTDFEVVLHAFFESLHEVTPEELASLVTRPVGPGPVIVAISPQVIDSFEKSSIRSQVPTPEFLLAAAIPNPFPDARCPLSVWELVRFDDSLPTAAEKDRAAAVMLLERHVNRVMLADYRATMREFAREREDEMVGKKVDEGEEKVVKKVEFKTTPAPEPAAKSDTVFAVPANLEQHLTRLTLAEARDAIQCLASPSTSSSPSSPLESLPSTPPTPPTIRLIPAECDEICASIQPEEDMWLCRGNRNNQNLGSEFESEVFEFRTDVEANAPEPHKPVNMRIDSIATMGCFYCKEDLSFMPPAARGNPRRPSWRY